MVDGRLRASFRGLLVYPIKLEVDAFGLVFCSNRSYYVRSLRRFVDKYWG